MLDAQHHSHRCNTVPGIFADISSVQLSGPLTNAAASKSWEEQQQGMQQEGHPQTTPMQGRQPVTAHTAYSITESGRKRHRQSSMMADRAAEVGLTHHGSASRQSAPSAAHPEPAHTEPLDHLERTPPGIDLLSTDVEGSWGDIPGAELPSSGSSLADKHASPLSEHSGRAAAAANRTVSRVMALQAERSRLHAAIQVCSCVMHAPVAQGHMRRFCHTQVKVMLLSCQLALQVHSSARQCCKSPAQYSPNRVLVK